MLLALCLIIPCLIHRSFQLTEKCCEQNSIARENNSLLQCHADVKGRLQIRSDSSGFLQNATNSGECIDSDGQNFFTYKIEGAKVASKIEATSSRVFHKCCPLNHVFNNQSHSCLFSNATEDFLEDRQFVKIGLSHCKMILNKFFRTKQEALSHRQSLDPGSFCTDKDLKGEFVVRECQSGLEICENKRCFKKCCPDGQSFVDGGNCKDTYVRGIKLKEGTFAPFIDDIEDEYELIYGAKCDLVSLVKQNTFQYSITKNGTYRYFHNFTGKFQEENYAQQKSYCLEHGQKGTVSGYFLFTCMDKKQLEDKFSFTMWAKILSIIFLFFTIVVYLFLGENASTFGKILVNYCLVMMILMTVLIVAHVVRNPASLDCTIRGYLLIYLNMSAFAWVNIMSVDIWWTFGTPRRTIGSDQRKRDRKKFILYSIYGWGMPLCHSLLILIFNKTRILPEWAHPYIGPFQCFLERRNHSHTILFLIPQLILQIINTVLFIKTITYCIRVKNEISKMNDTMRDQKRHKFSADKERLGLIVKLAVIMGIIWIFEVITAFFEMRHYSTFTKNLEIVFDNITCLQGVFIFLIFICKKKTFDKIKGKLGLGKRRRSCNESQITQSSNENGTYAMNKRQNTTMSLNDGRI